MNTDKLSNKKGKRFKRNKKNKSSKIKILIVMLVILVIVLVGLFFVYSSKDDNSDEEQSYEERKQVASVELLNEKIFEEMKIKDISLEIDEYASYFKCNIENTTDKTFEQQDVYIVFVKKDNSELARFKYHLEDILSNEIQKISVITTTILDDVYNFYIEK